MFLLHGDGQYIDMLERTLYNNVLDGVSLDGKEFFYPNPLASRGDYARSKWFDCSCCPTNICRFIPSVPGYAYAVTDDALYVNLFVEGSADLEVGGGKVRDRAEDEISVGRPRRDHRARRKRPATSSRSMCGFPAGRRIPCGRRTCTRISMSRMSCRPSRVNGTEFESDTSRRLRDHRTRVASRATR